MKLTQRMEGILSFCRPAGVIADIGCDHGMLTAELVRRGIAGKVIASDVSAPSLGKAERLARKLHIEEAVDCRLGSGLSILREGEAGGIVIAGMGAPLIMQILADDMPVAKNADYLVLSPNIYPERLRAFLIHGGFWIEREEMVHENKFYPVFLVKKGISQPYTEKELLIGKWDSPSQELKEYLEYEIQLTGSIEKRILAGGAREGPNKALHKLYRECYYELFREGKE